MHASCMAGLDKVAVLQEKVQALQDKVADLQVRRGVAHGLHPLSLFFGMAMSPSAL